MAPSWTYPPGSTRKFSWLRRRSPKRDRKLPGWTGNALVTAIISVVVSGVISYLVAHQASQDAARQATASQQVQQVIKLEADANTFFQIFNSAYSTLSKCYGIQPTQSCITAQTTIDNLNRTLGVDRLDVSDTALQKAADDFFIYSANALDKAGTNSGYEYSLRTEDAYDILIRRCVQVIQGRP